MWAVSRRVIPNAPVKIEVERVYQGIGAVLLRAGHVRLAWLANPE